MYMYIIYIYMHSYMLIPLHGPPFHLRAYIYVYRENKYTYAHIRDHVRRAGLGSWVACFTGSPCCPATRVRPKALGARRDGRLASPRCDALAVCDHFGLSPIVGVMPWMDKALHRRKPGMIRFPG